MRMNECYYNQMVVLLKTTVVRCDGLDDLDKEQKKKKKTLHLFKFIFRGRVITQLSTKMPLAAFLMELAARLISVWG